MSISYTEKLENYIRDLHKNPEFDFVAAFGKVPEQPDDCCKELEHKLAMERIAHQYTESVLKSTTTAYEALLNAPVRESSCPECKGTGADPLSDNLNWLPCRSCGGKP